MVGCSLMNRSPNGQKPDWDKLTPTIQSRVRYVAAFAFQMKALKTHKAQICEIATNISNMLDSYDDKDASFENVRAAVMDMISQISDPAIRDGATILVDIVLTEAFNYAWQYYEDMLNQDEIQTTILIARAIGAGLREACEMTVSLVGTQEEYAYSSFTVRK